jgi:hypothetical protein
LQLILPRLRLQPRKPPMQRPDALGRTHTHSK